MLYPCISTSPTRHVQEHLYKKVVEQNPTYKIKSVFSICIDEWKRLLFSIRLSLLLKLRLIDRERDAASSPLILRNNPNLILRHTVICPRTIVITELNLSCLSSCPEYQIRYFSSFKKQKNTTLQNPLTDYFLFAFYNFMGFQFEDPKEPTIESLKWQNFGFPLLRHFRSCAPFFKAKIACNKTINHHTKNANTEFFFIFFLLKDLEFYDGLYRSLIYF